MLSLPATGVLAAAHAAGIRLVVLEVRSRTILTSSVRSHSAVAVRTTFDAVLVQPQSVLKADLYPLTSDLHFADRPPIEAALRCPR